MFPNGLVSLTLHSDSNLFFCLQESGAASIDHCRLLHETQKLDFSFGYVQVVSTNWLNPGKKAGRKNKCEKSVYLWKQDNLYF